VDNKGRLYPLLKAGFAGFFFIHTIACHSLKRIDPKKRAYHSKNQIIGTPLLKEIPEKGIFTLGSDTIFTKTHYLGDTIEAVFYFTVLKEPLKILQVHPGCQCTAPIYPKDTIQPEQIDSIVLMFYTKKVHAGRFTKYAYVLNAVKEVDYFILGEVLELPKGIRPKRVRYTNR